MIKSTNEFIVNLFDERNNTTEIEHRMNHLQKERFNQHTVTIDFKASLSELLDKMKDSEPSFVRYVDHNVNVIQCVEKDFSFRLIIQHISKLV